jgi:hypothetical protein
MTQLRVGQVVRSLRAIPLVNNVHVVRLTHGPQVLPKGTEAEIESLEPLHIILNCKDGSGYGVHAWGLRIRIAKVVYGVSFG